MVGAVLLTGARGYLVILVLVGLPVPSSPSSSLEQRRRRRRGRHRSSSSSAARPPSRSSRCPPRDEVGVRDAGHRPRAGRRDRGRCDAPGRSPGLPWRIAVLAHLRPAAAHRRSSSASPRPSSPSRSRWRSSRSSSRPRPARRHRRRHAARRADHRRRGHRAAHRRPDDAVQCRRGRPALRRRADAHRGPRHPAHPGRPGRRPAAVARSGPRREPWFDAPLDPTSDEARRWLERRARQPALPRPAEPRCERLRRAARPAPVAPARTAGCPPRGPDRGRARPRRARARPLAGAAPRGGAQRSRRTPATCSTCPTSPAATLRAQARAALARGDWDTAVLDGVRAIARARRRAGRPRRRPRPHRARGRGGARRAVRRRARRPRRGGRRLRRRPLRPPRRHRGARPGPCSHSTSGWPRPVPTAAPPAPPAPAAGAGRMTAAAPTRGHRRGGAGRRRHRAGSIAPHPRRAAAGSSRWSSAGRSSPWSPGASRPEDYLHPDGTGQGGTRALVEVLRDHGIDVEVVEHPAGAAARASRAGTTVVVGNSDLLTDTACATAPRGTRGRRPGRPPRRAARTCSSGLDLG